MHPLLEMCHLQSMCARPCYEKNWATMSGPKGLFSALQMSTDIVVDMLCVPMLKEFDSRDGSYRPAGSLLDHTP